MIEIEEYWELLALHKAIMAAKFDNGSSVEMLTSPLLAEASRKVLSALIMASKKKAGAQKTSGWDNWKKIDENRNEWKRLVSLIAESDRYSSLGDDDVKREIRDIVSPLEITDEQIYILIKNNIRSG